MMWTRSQIWITARNVTLLATSLFSLSAKELFEPQIEHPLVQTSRWKPIESLDEYGVQCIAEAKEGIWFGTKNGLGFYDGIRTTVYTTNDGLSSNNITNIIVDTQNRIYAVTPKGISIFIDSMWKTISTLNSIDQPSTRAVCGPNGTVWIAHESGLIRMIEEDVLIYPFGDEGISEVMLDRSGNLWVAPYYSSHLIECKLVGNELSAKKDWIYHQLEPHAERELVFMDESSDGKIYVISNRNREFLHCYDPQSRVWSIENPHIENWNNEFTDIKVLNNDQIIVLSSGNIHLQQKDNWTHLDRPRFPIPGEKPQALQLKNGDIWIYGRGDNIYRISTDSTLWTTYEGINYIGDDGNEFEWYLHFDGRVIQKNKQNGKWTAFGPDDNLIDCPVSGLVSRDGTLWIAGSHEGKAAVCRFNGGRWVRDLHENFSFRIQHRSIFETQDGRICFGAEGNPAYYEATYDGGILEYYWDQGRYLYRYTRTESIPFRFSGMAESSKGEFWIAGRSVLKGDLNHFSKDLTDPRLLDTWSDTLSIDNDDNIWITRWGLGLMQYHTDSGEWKLFNRNNAPFGNNVSDIRTSSTGEVYITSPDGIYVYDGRSWSVPIIDEAISIDRNTGFLKFDSENKMWLNSLFYGWIIRKDENSQPLLPEDINRFSTTRVQRNEKAPETFFVEYSKKLASRSSAHFKWYGVDFMDDSPANTLQYAWRLDDGKWSPFSTQTSLYIESIKTGRHTLEVVARDRDQNIDPTPAKMEVVVFPPLWQNPKFVIPFLVLILLLATAIYIIIRLKIRHLSELESIKVEFFNNLTHELRTPLTHSLFPLEKLLKDNDSQDVEKDLKIIKKNTQTALQTIDGLLGLKEAVEPNKERSKGYIHDLIEETIQNAQIISNRKDHEIDAHISPFHKLLCFDSYRIENILNQLLIHASNQCTHGETIVLESFVSTNEKQHHKLNLTIEYGGAPIPADKRKYIFEPFFTASNLRNSNETGVSLTIAKTLCDQAEGTIRVESPIFKNENNREEGTRFYVCVPVFEQNTSPIQATESTENVAAENVIPILDSLEDIEEKDLVQIIISHEDFKSMITRELVDDYRIISSSTGDIGFRQARDSKPSLIIMDLPPDEEGLKWVNEFKATSMTSHIPLIFLSDSRSAEAENRFYEAGANEFIRKPIEEGILKTRISNLLNLQKNQRANFMVQDEMTQFNQLSEESDSFLKKAIQTMKENLRDDSFDVDDLARSMQMSRSTLYRRFKSITSESPAIYLRTLRLKQAAHLLEQTNLNISQVMTEVGILDASYFSKSFKTLHGCTPSKYRTANKENMNKSA